MTYQWFRNGVGISGATSPSYTLPAAALSDNGALFQVRVANDLGAELSRLALLTVTEAPQSSAPSDSFDGPTLDTDLWTYIDPLNDSALSLTGSQLVIDVPAGSSHFTWSGINTTPRIMQAADDVNFELEAKFDSPVTVGYQMQGLRIEQDLDNSLSVQFNHDGRSTVFLYGNVINGVAERPISVTVPDGAPMFVRVLRNGDDWTLSYSTDGNVWTVGFQINRSLNVTAVGVLAGNYANGLAPAHSMIVDEFVRRDLPTIATQPQDLSVEAPAPATFSVVAAGAGPFTYQWRRDGAPISGATGSSYTLDPTSAFDDGAAFDVIVTTASGSVTSRAATLSIAAPVSDPPVASADSYSVPFGGTFDSLVDLGASVLDNDTQPLGLGLTANLVTDVAHGTLTFFDDGTFRYEHDGSDVAVSEVLPGGANQLLEYGVDTAIDGDTLVIGSNAPEGIGQKTGAAYVFRRSGTTWALEAKLVPTPRAARQWFGWTVDIEGDTIVIGAPGDPHAGQWSGAAFIYQRDANGWTQQARLIAPDAQTLDEFGNAVSISGDTVAIGAYLDDGSLENSGAVYLFDRNGTSWNLMQKLTAPSEVLDGWYGFDVRLQDDTLAVGAMFDDELGLDAGAAFIYGRNGGTWSLEQKLTASDGGAGDTFGFSIALDGTTLAVGANAHVDGFGPAERGAVYLFDLVGGTWTEQQKLEGPTATTYGIFRFGVTVALEGDRLAIGGQDDGPNPLSGAVYVYDRQNGAWSLSRKLNATQPGPDEEFGADVTLQGNLVIAGSSTRKFSFQPDNRAGTAFVFRIGDDLLDSFTYVADDGQSTSAETTVTLERQP